MTRINLMVSIERQWDQLGNFLRAFAIVMIIERISRQSIQFHRCKLKKQKRNGRKTIKLCFEKKMSRECGSLVYIPLSGIGCDCFGFGLQMSRATPSTNCSFSWSRSFSFFFPNLMTEKKQRIINEKRAHTTNIC